MRWLPKRIPGVRMLMDSRQREESARCLRGVQLMIEDPDDSTEFLDVKAYMRELDADDLQHLSETEV